MELKLQRNLVLQELSILQGVVEHRTTIPILSSILTEAAEKSVRMVATDLDMTIMTNCPAQVDGGGRLTLESKVFQNLVRNLPEEEFSLRVVGDAVEMIASLQDGIDFVLLDLWKDLYVPCLEAFYPKLNPGAIVVADNMIWPGGKNVDLYAAAVRARPGMTSVLLPVGSGLEISRYVPD